jgi:hypothetical protein
MGKVDQSKRREKCNADGQTKGSSKKYLLDERIVK